MRNYIVITLLALFPEIAKAQAGVQIVHEVAASTSSITQTISVCNSVIDVAATTSSGTLTGAFAIEAYNLAASTSTMVCGFDVSLSSASTNAWYGREIAAGVGILWQKLTNRKLYCLSLNASGCNQATITQMK